MTTNAPLFPLKPDCRVIVTAAATGIGRAIADTFQANGARVFLCDIDAEALRQCAAEQPAFGTIACDVSDPDQIDRFFDAATAWLGGLDVLVNNAGVAGPTAPVEDIATDDWQRTIAVNINSHFYGARRAVPLLKAAGGGCIVNLSSAAGRLGFPLRSPYCASKWGVVGLTQALAVELGPHNIRVNAILPGATTGDRIDRVIAAKAEARGVSFETMHAEYTKLASMRRFVTHQEVANMVLFVCSDAGAGISGQSLGVCGNVEYLR